MIINSQFEKILLKILEQRSLAVLFYYFLKDDFKNRTHLSSDYFNGEIEKIAYASFKDDFVNDDDLIVACQLIQNKRYRKYLSVYHIIGLALQEKGETNKKFDSILEYYFKNHSVIYKYLIFKAFPYYKNKFIRELNSINSNSELKIRILRCIYLDEEIGADEILEYIENEANIDIPFAILIEDYQKRKKYSYNEDSDKLLELLLWCSTEVQSKHRIYNNNEDQYNSLFHSMLSKDYKVENQSQRGETLSGKLYGELDVKVFTIDGFPLSILEGFVIESIKKDYIKDHLIKLSLTYDPVGLKRNFALIYAKHSDFDLFWNRYKNFVQTINFPHKLTSNGVMDLTENYPQFSSVKIGMTEHLNRGKTVVIFHLFLDLYY